jgi:large subunit ribosomal protein LP0
MGGKTGTKAVYFDKLKGLLDEYKSIFIVSGLWNPQIAAH